MLITCMQIHAQTTEGLSIAKGANQDQVIKDCIKVMTPDIKKRLGKREFNPTGRIITFNFATENGLA